MEIVLVANPASGSGTDVGHVERALTGHGARVRTLLCSEVDAWLDAGREGLPVEGMDRVAVAGGDGSVGAAAALAAAAGVPLAVVPTGTANDFARHLELPLDAEEAAAIAADPDAPTRTLDLAWAGTRPFVNAASAGLSVAAARAASPFKRFLGPLAYPVGATAAAVREPPIGCRVTCDGDACFAGPAWQVTVAGTGAFGGGAEIGAAHDDDGRLDVAVLEGGPRLRLARHAAGLRSGRITEQHGVRHLRGREVRVEGAREWNVDGEAVRLDEPAFRVEREAFEAVVAP